MYRIFFSFMVLGAVAWNGCGSQNGESDADDAASDVDADDEAGECELGELCIPFAWSCDGDGDPVECSENGDAWLPREACASGQTCDPETGWCECGPCEVPVEGGCERVGAQCVEGWVDDGECGCEPILDECAEDEIALIGGGCVGVGAYDDCGEGTWGNIPTDANTIYVDRSYSVGDYDGSRGKPFNRIGLAVNAVPEDALDPVTIAIASGIYGEQVVANRPVALIGRCPSMVTVTAPLEREMALWIEADGSSVSGLTVEGQDDARFGIYLIGATDMSINNVIIRSAVDVGILCEDCEVEITGVTVADIDSRGISEVGRGIDAWPGSGGTRCSVLVKASEISNTSGIGIRPAACGVEIKENRIRQTGGPGISINHGAVGEVKIHDNVIEDAFQAAVILSLDESRVVESADISRNQIRAIPAYAPSEGWEGLSIGIQVASTGSAKVKENVIEDSGASGIVIQDVDNAVVESNLVSRIDGKGLQVSEFSTDLRVRHNSMREVHGMGIHAVYGGTIDIMRNSVISVDVGIITEDIEGAHGIGALQIGEVTVSSNRVSGAKSGIVVTQTLGSVDVRENMVNDCHHYGISLGHHHEDNPASIVANLITKTMFPLHPFDISAGEVSVADNAMMPVDGTMGGDNDHYAVGISPLNVSGIAIENNLIAFPDLVFSDSVSYGIYFADSAGKISQNRITDAGNSGIVLFGSETWEGSGTQVTDNVVVGSLGSGIHGEWLGPVAGALLSGNVISGGWPEILDDDASSDGISLVDSPDAGPVVVQDNQLAGNGRTGMFISNVEVTVEDNEINFNSISVAWQDGADVTLTDNDIRCNDSDQPMVDQGMSVPDPPKIVLH